LIALQTQRDVVLGKATYFLHNWLSKNSTAGLPYITDGMANVEVWEERKPYLAVGYYKLCTQKER